MTDLWISRKRKSKFVELFPSQIPNDIWCPSFWYAKPVHGCSHRCKTCFMHNIKDKYNTPNTIFNNVNDMINELKEWNNKHKNTMLCFGTETSDMFKDKDKIVNVWKQEPEDIVLNIFKDSSNKVLFLSKSDNVEWFYRNRPCDNIVVSFSINGLKSSSLWEVNTCSMTNRLKAIKKLTKLGWTVRVRVDPLIIDSSFYKDDIKYIADFLNDINIEEITSGVMRRNKKPLFNIDKQIEGIGHFFNLLSNDTKNKFMVCKTHLQVIDKLSLKGHHCNCMYGHKILSNTKHVSINHNSQLSFL